MPARARGRPQPALTAYIGVLGALAIAIVVVVSRRGVMPPGTHAEAALLVLWPLLVVAEHLFVQFRFREEVSSINLVEAVLAPMLFAFLPAQVVLVAAAAPLVVAIRRRNPPQKTAFNVAQWALAAACGAAVVSFAGTGPGPTPGALATVALALAVVGVVNHVSFAGVMVLARGESVVTITRELGPALVVGWGVGFVVNVLTGLLFVAAYAGHPSSVVLFPVPLLVLHVAYRSYAGARSDRLRLAGLHRAAGVLAAPFDPTEAIRPYLREVAHAFEAQGAELVLLHGDTLEVHAFHTALDPRHSCREERLADHTLAAGAVRLAGPVRVDANHALAPRLARAGWRSALAAPLIGETRTLGALLVLDQEGLVGFEQGELAVVEAFARETASSLKKGHLVAEVLEERQKLAEIVNSTSDAMCTLDADGCVQMWNPACERLFGLAAADIIGRELPFAALRMRTDDGRPVHIDVATAAAAGPAVIRVTTPEGREHKLACSYAAAVEGTEAVLVVVGRDITPVEEVAQLREQVDELAAAEAQHRSVVEKLQEALTPPPPAVPRADLAVAFQASDPAAPTGGDLYDWQVLPSGELHLTVVDVLGHGVAATRDALNVISTLRILALQDCPLDDLIRRADAVLAAGDRDVVATVVIARFDPETGRLRIASGGHPPPIVVSPTGTVRQLVAPGCAIGWPDAGSLVVVETALDPGDSLVLYTDGLVEARKDILEGLDVLMAEAARTPADSSAGDIADRLLSRCLAGAARSDDSLVLVMRAAVAGARESWDVELHPSAVAGVRRRCAAWFSEHGADDDVVQDIRLIASELVANAIRAARSSVRCEVSLAGPWLTLEVIDDGDGGVPEIDLITLAPPGAVSGRGLGIARSLAEHLRARRDGDRTHVTATLRRQRSPLATGEDVADRLEGRPAVER